jgi:hypothetical protein
MQLLSLLAVVSIGKIRGRTLSWPAAAAAFRKNPDGGTPTALARNLLTENRGRTNLDSGENRDVGFLLRSRASLIPPTLA